MSKNKAVDFPQLMLSGENYLIWSVDIRLNLNSKELENTLIEGNKETTAKNSTTLCFIRHHMMEALKIEYLTIEDPHELWEKLKLRYGHQADVILPKARYEWSNLRFQDFKSVTEYNSEVHRILSTRTLCGDKLSDEEIIDKTLSTFPHTRSC